MKIESFLKLSSEYAKTLESVPDITVTGLPTGVLAVDLASGIGGFPKGRIVEVAGEESAGKTTLTIHAIAECQRRGKWAAFVDLEAAFDPDYAAHLGVDKSKLLFCQPDTLNEGINAVREYCRIDEVELIILDSLAISTTEQIEKSNTGDANIGSKARLLAQELPQLVPKVSVGEKVLVLLNGIREKPGAYGNPTVIPGGRAVAQSASMRILMRRANVKESEVGVDRITTKARFIKNKCAPPYTNAVFDIVFGEGADNSRTLYELGLEYGILKKKGNSIIYEFTHSEKGIIEVKLGVGEKQAIAYLQSKDNKNRATKIEEKIRTKVEEEGYRLSVKKSSSKKEDEGLQENEG